MKILNRNIVDFTLDEKPYSVYISKAVCFPQAYAAVMPIYQRIRQYPKVAVLDIGGFTADYLIVKNGEADLSVCDSLDNGIITLYNRIKSKVNADYDMLLDESDIDAILRELPVDYDENIIFSLMKYPPILRAMSYCSKPLVWGDVNGEEGFI